jgi:hypothetical protein
MADESYRASADFTSYISIKPMLRHGLNPETIRQGLAPHRGKGAHSAELLPAAETLA